MLELRPILSSLWRNKVAALLIALQLALTLAVVSNASSFMDDRWQKIARPTGMAVNDVLTVYFTPMTQDYELSAAVDADLALIRAIAGVVEATHSHSVPLSNSGDSFGLYNKPNQQNGGYSTGYFFVGAEIIDALGMELIAGRSFEPTEISNGDRGSTASLNKVIVTRQLAQQLYPDENAQGKYLYFAGSSVPIQIVGIVANNLGVYPHSSIAGNAAFWPHKLVQEGHLWMDYLIRTEPGHRDAVFKQLKDKLSQRDPLRVISVSTLEDIKNRSYGNDISMIKVLCIVVLLLTFTTALGIIGLTNFWISQRRRQIGVRRALGASRRVIVRYFLLENLMIACAGILMGLTAAQLGNKLLVDYFSQPALPSSLALACALMLLVISLGSALAPALRAANITPAMATRSI